MVAPRETFSRQNPWRSQTKTPLNTPRMSRNTHNRNAQEPFRNDFREFQIELRLRDCRFGGGDGGLIAEIRLNGVVELLLADDLVLRERSEAFDIDLGFSQRSFGLSELPLRLVERRLIGSRVDLKHKLAGLDVRGIHLDSGATKVVAFDAVPDDKRGVAEVSYWSDVPPATKDYAAARDVIAHHIHDLIPALAALTARPELIVRGIVTAIDERNARIASRLPNDRSEDFKVEVFKVQDGLVFNAVRLGDQVEVSVGSVDGARTIVGLAKE